MFCGSIYWVLLLSGLVSVPKPLSQIQRSTRWLLQGLSPRTSFGGFGFSPSNRRYQGPMNHTVYRHLSIACSVMRGSLRLMLEGSGEFEVVGRARDGEEGGGGLGCGERTASAICSGCALWRSSSGASWATTLTIPPTSSASPASATAWSRGRGRDRRGESSDSSGWTEPRRRHRPSGLAIIVGWWALGGASQSPQPHLEDSSVYRQNRPTRRGSNSP